MKKISTIGLMLIILFTSACGSNEVVSEKGTLKIGYLPITHAAPLYFEKEFASAYMDGVEIELVKFGSWIDLMDALNTGRIDGASVLIELAMKAKEKGVDLKAVALGHKDGNAAIVAPGIESVTDLKGETVAIPHTLSSQNILLHDMLKEGDMTYNDINVVEMTPPEMPSALAAGTISSYIVAEPFGALGVTLDQGKVLYQSEDLWPNSLCCALVLRNDVIKHNREVAQQLVTGYVKAGEKVEKLDKDAYDVHKKYLSIDEQALDLSLEWISYDDLRLEKEDYDVLRESLLEMGLSEGPPSYEAFVDNSLIDQVKVE